MLNHKRSALSLALAVVLAPTLASAQSTQSTTTPTGTAATNLDTVTSQKIHDLILALNRDLGTGFVLVTHDPALAALANRILTMRDGLFAKETAGEPAA